MQFLWNGSTWTTSADDAPSNPIAITEETGGSLQRTYNGTARRVHRYSKRTFGFNWSGVGTNAPATYCLNMLTAGGTVTIAYHQGTYVTQPVPGSFRYDETGYYVYDISMSFAEV